MPAPSTAHERLIRLNMIILSTLPHSLHAGYRCCSACCAAVRPRRRGAAAARRGPRPRSRARDPRRRCHADWSTGCVACLCPPPIPYAATLQQHTALLMPRPPPTRHCCASPCLCTGAALHDKETERSLRDIEASLLVTAAQCVLDDEDEVGGWALAHAQLIGVAEHPTHMLA